MDPLFLLVTLLLIQNEVDILIHVMDIFLIHVIDIQNPLVMDTCQQDLEVLRLHLTVDVLVLQYLVLPLLNINLLIVVLVHRLPVSLVVMTILLQEILLILVESHILRRRLPLLIIV
jgi:hypothetical protein